MFVNGKLLEYLRQGVANLLEAGQFENGREFRPTQRESLLAYKIFLDSPDLPDREKLTGYFEVPTGIGKTAIFSGISGVVHVLAAAESKCIRTVIVVPTTQLLTQTRNDLENFSPSLMGKIGLYGGEEKDRDLSKHISIITYASWLTLMEKGELHSGNIDILISDEAHRGTSIRQLTNLFNAFDSRTARLAFTATAHFDKTKSVQKTHHNEIFYKSIGDSVRGGELAAYIQTQMHIIRAMPPKNLKPEFDHADDEADQRYRRTLRQTAWNKAAVAFFRDGMDMHTGDPISDNQAGFFTDGIHQANELEKMLNADPILAMKAAENGFKAVAVVVHSRLSGSEQKKRMDAYKMGEYMAAIGDEKFKEGYDHPPMKTIIDYPHASLIDKAQIIGRGARQWFNSAKDGRAEGLTFVDTIVYIGSDNQQEDERLKKSALRNSVLAWDILQGTVVLGPGAEECLKEKKENEKGDEPLPLTIEGVESHVDPVDVNTLFGDREKLRRGDWIEITEEMRQKLNSKMIGAGVGPVTILNKLGNPEGLTKETIRDWRKGSAKRVDPKFWHPVIEVCETLPDFRGKITFTEGMRKIFIKRKSLAGAGARKILDCSDVPEGLTEGVLNSLVSKRDDGSWRTQSILRDHWIWVLVRLKGLSDAQVGHRPNTQDNITERQGKITEKMRAEYIEQKTRTSASARRILDCSDVPEGLKGDTIQNLTAKRADGSWLIRNIDFNHWNWLMARMKALPDSSIKIEITEKIRAEYIAQKIRTGAGVRQILDCPDVPEGLTRNVINSLTTKNPDGGRRIT